MHAVIAKCTWEQVTPQTGDPSSGGFLSHRMALLAPETSIFSYPIRDSVCLHLRVDSGMEPKWR